jgi:hypothetical protein
MMVVLREDDGDSCTPTPRTEDGNVHSYDTKNIRESGRPAEERNLRQPVFRSGEQALDVCAMCIDDQ